MNETGMGFRFIKTVSARYSALLVIIDTQSVLQNVHNATRNNGKWTCRFKCLREVTGLGRNTSWSIFPWHLIQPKVNEGHWKIWVGQWNPKSPSDKGLPASSLEIQSKIEIWIETLKICGRTLAKLAQKVQLRSMRSCSSMIPILTKCEQSMLSPTTWYN